MRRAEKLALMMEVHRIVSASSLCLFPFHRRAEKLALMMEVPSRYSVERLKGGLKTTVLYNTLEDLPPAAPIATTTSLSTTHQQHMDTPAPGMPAANGTPQLPTAHADPAAAAPSGSSAPPPAAAPDTDFRGVPYVKPTGVQLAPWLCWGALKSFDSALALHALNPAMRKHWACPGCAMKLIGEECE